MARRIQTEAARHGTAVFASPERRNYEGERERYLRRMCGELKKGG